MAATIDVRKGGRLRLHVSGMATPTATGQHTVDNITTFEYFTVPVGFRIEYLYAVITADIATGSEQGISLVTSSAIDSGAIPALTNILKVDKFFISGTLGTSSIATTFIDMTPQLNLRTFCVNPLSTTGDAVIRIITYNNATPSVITTATPSYKLIVGLETIL
jgi:hypothetical protein